MGQAIQKRIISIRPVDQVRDPAHENLLKSSWYTVACPSFFFTFHVSTSVLHLSRHFLKHSDFVAQRNLLFISVSLLNTFFYLQSLIQLHAQHVSTKISTHSSCPSANPDTSSGLDAVEPRRPTVPFRDSVREAFRHWIRETVNKALFDSAKRSHVIDGFLMSQKLQ